MGCLSEERLSAYLDEAMSLSAKELQGIEEHVAGCSRCLEFLLVAHEAARRGMGGRADKCPALLKKKIKERLGLKGARRTSRPEAKWLFGAMVLFGLSFVFKRYFLQFLIGAAVLGFKWAMEGEGARRVVMIFKGMKGDEKKFSRGERKSPPPVSRITGGDRYGEDQ